MAARLSARLGVPHVEIDALLWKPGWVERDRAELRELVAAATAGEGWVTSGNYWSSVAERVTLPRADTVVWLDLPRRTTVRRVGVRTIRRSLTREDLWGTGNREHLGALFADGGIVRWSFMTAHYRHRCEAALHDPRWTHVEWVRLRSATAVRRWLRSVRGR